MTRRNHFTPSGDEASLAEAHKAQRVYLMLDKDADDEQIGQCILDVWRETFPNDFLRK